MTKTVDLVVPIKSLRRAKSRLDSTAIDPDTRAALALAFAVDTVTAALATDRVRRVLPVTSDAVVAATFATLGVHAVVERADNGMNAAIRHAVQMLRPGSRGVSVGVLVADLPALRPSELAAALAAADGGRAFCTDRRGTGTTLLLAAPDTDLRTRFGPDSARAHAASGAAALTGAWPSLRCDVDTPDDLREASTIGLGPCSTRALAGEAVAPQSYPSSVPKEYR